MLSLLKICGEPEIVRILQSEDHYVVVAAEAAGDLFADGRPSRCPFYSPPHRQCLPPCCRRFERQGQKRRRYSDLQVSILSLLDGNGYRQSELGDLDGLIGDGARSEIDDSCYHNHC